MPFNLINFQPFDKEAANPFGTALTQAITNRLTRAKAEEQEEKNPYVGRQSLADVIHQELINKFLPEEKRSEIDYRSANTNKLNTMTPLEAKELEIKNQFGEQREKAELEQKKAMANYYQSGGSRGGVTAAQESVYNQLVAKDNPQITDPVKIREAANAIAQGKSTLEDGTPINPPSPDTLRALDKAIKNTTTAALVTNQVRANQAEAELPVVDKYISEGRKPYGDTIFGISPQLQKDSFATRDDAAQTRLGKYFAADLLNFDKAALQTRIAGTESGVTIINEVMEKARQSINSNTLLKTDRARQVALETVSSALRDMLKARNKFGIGISAVGRNNNENNNVENYGAKNSQKGSTTPELTYNIATGEFE